MSILPKVGYLLPLPRASTPPEISEEDPILEPGWWFTTPRGSFVQKQAKSMDPPAFKGKLAYPQPFSLLPLLSFGKQLRPCTSQVYLSQDLLFYLPIAFYG